MATIGIGSFEPLEGLASSGKKYGAGDADTNSQQFPALTGYAYQDVRGAYGALVLPMLEMDVSMIEGGSGVGDLLLPRLTATGGTGAQSHFKLPHLTATGTGTVFGQALVTMSLPMLQISGSGLAGGLAEGDLRLPSLTIAGWFAGRGAVTLPLLQVAGASSFINTGIGVLYLPLLRSSGTVSVFSYSSAGAMTLPMLVGGPYTRGDILLPLLSVVGYDAGATAGDGAGAFEGWILNTRNGHVGHITNWPFTKIVKWGNLNLGVAADGLYQIGGTTDRGAVIPWEWRTGMDDLGQPGIKRFPMLYVDAVIEGEVFIITKDDQGNVRRYRYEADRGRIHMPHRRELGKGVRTRNAAVGMTNGPAGAFVEIDGIEPEATVTQRSI